MTDPLYDAVLGGVIGGALTGAAYVALGYVLQERAIKRRQAYERARVRAKAAMVLGVAYLGLATRVNRLPKSTAELKEPVTQLMFGLDAVFEFVPRNDFVNMITDLPSDVQNSALVPIRVSSELEQLLKAVRDRVERMTNTGPTDASPAWSDQHRAWEPKDTSDADLVRLFEPVRERRLLLLESINSVIPRLRELSRTLDSEF